MAGILDTAGSAIGSAMGSIQDFDWGSFLQSDQFSNLLGTGADIWGAIQTGEAMDKQFELADASMAMSQDAYARDKEAEEKRQSLSFA